MKSTSSTPKLLPRTRMQPHPSPHSGRPVTQTSSTKENQNQSSHCGTLTATTRKRHSGMGSATRSSGAFCDATKTRTKKSCEPHPTTCSTVSRPQINSKADKKAAMCLPEGKPSSSGCLDDGNHHHQGLIDGNEHRCPNPKDMKPS